MSKRWSKLQKEIYNLLDNSIDIQIHCGVYRMKSQRGSTDLPRYWITIGKEIVFDYPKQFLDTRSSDCMRKMISSKYQIVRYTYPYSTDISSMSDLIREYIDTPVKSLLYHNFENDLWGLTDILKASDRRLGKAKLLEYFKDTNNNTIQKILVKRN